MRRRTGILYFLLVVSVVLTGCVGPYRKFQIGDSSLPQSTLSGNRWEDGRLAFITRILEVDGVPTKAGSIWKDADNKTEFLLPVGRHSLLIEVREHSTFNEACRAYGRAEVSVNLISGRRYYLRSIISGDTAQAELVDIATFEVVATFPNIAVRRGILGLPIKL